MSEQKMREALKLCAAVLAGETLNKGALIRALESAHEALAEQPAQVEQIQVWCDVCDGRGTIDETLGGEHFSNPKADCPNCERRGWWLMYRPAPPAPAVPEPKAAEFMTICTKCKLEFHACECAFNSDDHAFRCTKRVLIVQPVPGLPQGWKPVPVEPTRAMVQAGAKLVKGNKPSPTGTRDIYLEMLAAAPASPAPSVTDDVALRERLAAISEAIADGDDRAALAIIDAMLAAAPEVPHG